MKNSTRLYAAYGSNLNTAQMALRCPTAKIIGTGRLKGWRLMFRGGRGNAVATIERHKNGNVPVLVWQIKPYDEAALDRYEGYPWLYRKETVNINLQGKPFDVMIYIMNACDDDRQNYRPFNQPDPGYYATILTGYRNAGFNIKYLHNATLRCAEMEGL